MAAGVRGGGDIAVALAFRLEAAYGAVAVDAAELEVVRDIAHDVGVQLHDSGGVGPLFLNRRKLRQVDLGALNIGTQMAGGEAVARMLILGREIDAGCAGLDGCARHGDQLVGKVDLRLRAIEWLAFDRSGMNGDGS